jgi:hypothetical protein
MDSESSADAQLGCGLAPMSAGRAGATAALSSALLALACLRRRSRRFA